MRDAAKHELIEKFKNGKDCSWVNSLKRSFTSADVVANSQASGWLTSYEVAKAEGMDHESDVFKGLLQHLDTRPADQWPDEGMHMVYKRMNLPGYFYSKENLAVRKHKDTNADEIGSASTGACSKKALLAKFMARICLVCTYYVSIFLACEIASGQVRHFG